MHRNFQLSLVLVSSNCSNGQGLGRLVSLSSTPHSAYTCDLSMSWSRTALTLYDGIPNLEACFALRCFQRLSLTDLATQLMHLAVQLVHQRSTLPGPLVLGETLLKYPTPAIDRDRTVSRRSEPSSRTALMGEQPNPWDPLQPQDAMSRHRGAKHRRRYGLSGGISLLSPG